MIGIDGHPIKGDIGHRAPAFEGIGSDLIREAALEGLSKSSDAVQAQRSSEKARKGNRPLVSLQAALEGMSRMTCKHPSHEDGGAMNNRHPVNTLPTPCPDPADITETETETQTETRQDTKPGLKQRRRHALEAKSGWNPLFHRFSALCELKLIRFATAAWLGGGGIHMAIPKRFQQETGQNAPTTEAAE